MKFLSITDMLCCHVWIEDFSSAFHSSSASKPLSFERKSEKPADRSGHDEVELRIAAASSCWLKVT
jgi:hypothetical protein